MRKPIVLKRCVAALAMLMLPVAWTGVGCQTTHDGSSDPSMRSDPAGSQDPGNATTGKQLFDSQGCVGCHKVNGQGGTIGPDLSNIANEGHSREWLAQQIRHPKSHVSSSVMPSYDNLSSQQVNDLVAYLMTLSTK